MKRVRTGRRCEQKCPRVAATKMPTRPDRCDVSGLCGTDGQTCAELTKTYDCADYYAKGKAYAGWCDRTCGICTPRQLEKQAEGLTARAVGWNSTFALFDSPQVRSLPPPSPPLCSFSTMSWFFRRRSPAFVSTPARRPLPPPLDALSPPSL